MWKLRRHLGTATNEEAKQGSETDGKGQIWSHDRSLQFQSQDHE